MPAAAGCGQLAAGSWLRLSQTKQESFSYKGLNSPATKRGYRHHLQPWHP